MTFLWGGARMSRPSQILSAVAIAGLVAGCSSAEQSSDAGPDAGFHYTGLSVGSATFAGGLTGTVAANGFAFSMSTGYPLLDGGNSGPYVYVQISDDPQNTTGTNFSCAFNLYGITLDAGVFTPANVDQLLCFVVVSLPDGGTGDQWWGGYGGPFGPPNTFELELTSPGPASVSSSGTNWFDPSATLSVYLASSAPLTAPADETQGVILVVTVAPRPCPTYCAPGPP
jgi:hypothetical protein